MLRVLLPHPLLLKLQVPRDGEQEARRKGRSLREIAGLAVSIAYLLAKGSKETERRSPSSTAGLLRKKRRQNKVKIRNNA